MKPSDEIFQLIKSLSKQEKGYFKKIATAFSEDDGSNYLALFDEIVKQTTNGNQYDEGKIKKAIYSGKFLKNFSFHKNYLYNMILNSLTSCQKDNTDLIPIRNLISQAEILSDKLLFEQSLKVLLRAKKMSIEKDKFSYLFEILNLERQISKNIHSSEEFSEKGKFLFEEQYKALETIKNSLDYYFLNDKIGNICRKMGTGMMRNEKQSDEIDELFKNPFLTDVNEAKTFFSKTLFNTMNFQYQLIRNDYEKGYGFVRDNVNLWEENLLKSGGKLDNYIYALNNLLTSQIRTKRFDECDITVSKMKDIEKKFPKHITEKNKVFIFYSTSVLMLSENIENVDAKGLEDLEKEIENEMGNYEHRINLYQRIILYYFLGISNFVRSEYNKSIYWMGKIINMEKTDLSQDYQCYSRIIYLISFFELGHFDSLEYALKSVYHFLSKKERVYVYENIILKYLKRSFRIKSNSELDEMFFDMKKEMEKIYSDPFEQNAFDAFNILYWLESKIKKIPMIEVMKDKRLISEKSITN